MARTTAVIGVNEAPSEDRGTTPAQEITTPVQGRRLAFLSSLHPKKGANETQCSRKGGSIVSP